MEKVSPAIFDVQAASLFLAAGLAEKEKVAAIIKFPGITIFRKHSGMADRRAGGVLAQAGGIDHERTGGQPIEDTIGILRTGNQMRGQRHIGRTIHGVEMIQARLTPVSHMDLGGSIRLWLVEEMPSESHGRTAGAEDEDLCIGFAPIIKREKSVQGQPAGHRVNGSGMQLTLAFKDAADFAQVLGKRIDGIKEGAASCKEVNFVSGDQSPERQWIIFDELDRSPVPGRIVVDLEIEADELANAELELFSPEREYAVDG